jgi:hypothetical protein
VTDSTEGRGVEITGLVGVNHANWSWHGEMADRNWISTWDGHTPLDTARREGADELVAWLRTLGAKTADELTGRTKEGG